MGDDFKLSGLTGQYSGQEFPLEPGEHSIGRGEDSTMQLLDPRVSRTHARLIVARGACRVEDLGSTDGTYLNGERVTEASLKDGDKLRFGGSVFLFHAPVPAPARQVEIPTLLDADASAPTRLGGEAERAEPEPEADATRVSAPGKQPSTVEAGDGKTPPPAVPPGPPPTRGWQVPWRGVLLAAGGLAALGAIIVLGLVWFGGSEEPPGDELPDVTAVFDAPTAGPTWTPLVEALTRANEPAPTAGPATAATPELSPPPTAEEPSGTDGSWPEQIAFASDRSGRPQIYLVDLEDGDTVQLTDLPAGACQPAWRPDGEWLAFISPCSSNREEYNGASIYSVQVGPDGALGDATPLITTLTGGEYDPAWSPDGGEIAFTSLRTGRPQIFIAAADGTGARNLNNDLAYNWSPAWSPAGDQLAFLSGRGGQEEIWLIPAAGGEERRFTRGDGKHVTRPAWSPDGAAIVFEKVVGNIPRLMAAPLADGGQRQAQICQEGQLSLQPMGEPAWSPDGSWLSFATWPDGIEHRIAIMQPGCSGYRELTQPGGIDFDPAWRPGS